MRIVQHEFTKKILEILNHHFPNQGDRVQQLITPVNDYII